MSRLLLLASLLAACTDAAPAHDDAPPAAPDAAVDVAIDAAAPPITDAAPFGCESAGYTCTAPERCIAGTCDLPSMAPCQVTSQCRRGENCTDGACR